MQTAKASSLLLWLALAPPAGGCGSKSSEAPPPLCGGATPAAVTVANFLDWCSVSVAGHPASTAGAQTVCVASGPVALSATALPGFVLGPAPWHHTDGDHGAGDPGTVTGTGQSAISAATLTVSGSSACAWVCCPFADGTGCPTADQCVAAGGY